MSIDVGGWVGRTLLGADGEIGRVADIFVDDATDEPRWLAIQTRRQRGRLSFVPISEAHEDGHCVAVKRSAEFVLAAPTAGTDGVLAPEDEIALFEHYGLRYDVADATPIVPVDDTAPRDATQDMPAAAQPASELRDGTGEIVRSEEELHLSTRPVEAGRVRLRKRVETETVTHSVPVTREELRIEREPITGKNVEAALEGAEIGEAEYEIVLNEDTVVAAKVTVPKERIRVDKATVTEQREVAAELRRERVDIEEDR